MRLPGNSVTICPRPGCGGTGAVENTLKADSWYVKRSRCCNRCGRTWSTAEVPLGSVQRLMKVESFLRSMGLGKKEQNTSRPNRARDEQRGLSVPDLRLGQPSAQDERRSSAEEIP